MPPTRPTGRFARWRNTARAAVGTGVTAALTIALTGSAPLADATPSGTQAAPAQAPSSAVTAAPQPAEHHVVNDYVLGARPLPSTGPVESKPATKSTKSSKPAPTLKVAANVDLRAHAPAVGDQGDIADCTAWSIGYSIMGYWDAVDHTGAAPFAPLYLYLKSLRGSNTPPAGGTSGWDSLTVASTTGVDTQADYVQGTDNWQTSPTAAEDANASHFLVTGWSHLFEGANQGPKAQQSIEQALNAGDPVALGIDVFRNFESLGPNQVYQGPAGPYLGGHMVTVYGYNGTGVIVRNSWGTSWGTSGDALLSWSFVDHHAIDAYSVAGISVAPTVVPVVNSVSADAATTAGGISTAGGDTVTVDGTGFTGATRVHIGTATIPATVTSDTELQFIAPKHAPGAVDVVVVAPGGKVTSAVSAGDVLTYVAPPAPEVSAVNPTSVMAWGGDPVTVTGSALAQVVKVLVDGKRAHYTVVDDNTLTVVTPEHAAGTVDVQVFAPYTASDVSGSDQITYVAPPPPTLDSIAPTSGLSTHQTLVTITGTNLSHATKVLFGGVPIPRKSWTDTSVTVLLPQHPAGPVDLQVVTAGGTTDIAPADVFTFIAAPAPHITNLSLHSGRHRVSTTLDISGSAFTGATSVYAGSQPVPFTVMSDSDIRVTLPPHVTGRLALRVNTLAGTSPAIPADAFTYRW